MAYPLFHELGPAPALVVTRQDFARSFPHESDYVEFKQGLPEHKISEAAAAFSNADGGVVLLGVTDSGQLRGLETSGETIAKVHRAVRNVRDVGRYVVEPLEVDGHSLIVVAVYRRREGFAQLQDGRVLVRRGAINVPLFGQELTAFLSERSLTRFESTVTQVPLAAAAETRLELLRNAHQWPVIDLDQRLIDNDLVSRTPTAEGPMLTVAGVLLLTDRPSLVVGKAFIEMFRYRDGANWDRRQQFDGPLPQQIEDAVTELVAELGSDVVILGLHRHELARVPETVLREAVANAVAHRSYEVTGQPVRIELRPDRVVIRSPGGLPEPVTLANIREQNAPRNLQVIKALRRFRLAEDAGLGVDVMQDEMEAALLEPPEFDSDGSYVAVTLKLGSTVSPRERAWLSEVERRGQIRKDDRLILLHAARGEPLTNTTIRTLLAVDSTHARAALSRLRDLQFLHQHGERGGAYYTLAGDLGPPSGLQLDPAQLRGVITSMIADGGRITNEDVRRQTGLDRARALALLTSMVEAGMISRHGQRRGSYYTR